LETACPQAVSELITEQQVIVATYFLLPVAMNW
jgi:hypothetical protein